MRFVASLMPAKFFHYDRGVQLSQHRLRENLCDNKITKFSRWMPKYENFF
jgi:hypothetical protein